MSRGRKAAYLLIANLGTFAAAALLIEAGGRIFLAVRPAYDVLYLQPEPRVGWTQVPHLRFTWAGADWFAREFSVPIEVNSYGFRDREWQRPKPPGVRRVALLGDSFVEGLQVPVEQTVGQVLEGRLRRKDRRWEVLTGSRTMASANTCSCGKTTRATSSPTTSSPS